MIVAVSASTPETDGPADSRFGRAPWFILYDLDRNTSRAIENSQNLNAAQGAGVQSAEVVSREGAQAVLTGHCGPKAFRALTAAGITVYTGCSGTVAEVVKAFREGAYRPATAPDATGHSF